MGDYTFADFVFNLAVTVLMYAAFPVVLMLSRKKPITKSSYRWMCFGLNAVVWIAVSAYIVSQLGGSVSKGGAYILWTIIFSAIGVKYLTGKGLIADAAQVSTAAKTSDEKIAELVELYKDKTTEELEKIISGHYTDEAKEAARRVMGHKAL